MLHALAIMTLLLTGADHWTTYLCLREPIAGWQVIEANPVVDLLFRQSGLVGGTRFVVSPMQHGDGGGSYVVQFLGS